MLLLIAGALFAVTILAVAAFGAGFWIVDLLPPSFSSIEQVAFALLGGLGIISLVLFLVGQLAFTRATILGTVTVFVFLSIRPVRRLLRVPSSAWKIQVGVIPTTVIGLVLLITAVAGLAEITGNWENDAIAYHLLGPKVWLHDGMIRPLPETSTTAFPATSEVLFGALYALGGQRAPNFSALLTLACFFVMTYSLAKAVGLDERGSWWAVAFTASMPAVYAGAHSGFIDVLYAAFILAAARVGFDAEGQRRFILFGLFCGLGMATKYTALTAVPVLVFCAVLSQYFGRRIQNVSALKYAVLAILIGAAVASPYYVRNWILLGCPIYPPPPFFANLVSVKFFSSESLHRFHALLYERGSGLGRGLVAYILLPYNLTYHTSNFNGAGGIGLTGLAFGPLGLFAVRSRVFAKVFALFAIFFTTLWFLTLQESRYLIPAYPVAAVFAALGWRYVESVRPRSTRALCGLVITCSLLYGLFMIESGRWNDLRCVFSPSFAKKWHEETIPYLRSFEYLNADSSVNRVLVLDVSVPVFYLDKAYLKPFGQWGEQVLPEATNAGQVLREIGALKVSHILDVHSNVSDFQVPENAPRLKLVFQAENQRVYRVQ
jgi:4-amino-4-deoxy-L-arabinose transferase-like glycosyltransferase